MVIASFFFDAVSLVFYGYVLVFAHVALLVAVVFLFFLSLLAAVVDALTTPSSLYISVFFFFFLENHSYFPSLFTPKEEKRKRHGTSDFLFQKRDSSACTQKRNKECLPTCAIPVQRECCN